MTLPGGDLVIDWRDSDDHVLMTGPFALDFEGSLPADLLQPARAISSSGLSGRPHRSFHVRSRHMSDIEIITFGCRLNAYESEVMREHASDAGLADAVIVNTCAVTPEGVRQARQAIRRARREHPTPRSWSPAARRRSIPRRFAAMDEVDHVIGNQEKLEARPSPGSASTTPSASRSTTSCR